MIGIVIGAVVGAAIGYFGKCASGACPLTYTGAMVGALFDALITLGR